MTSSRAIPVFFHRKQLCFRPEYEWVGGARIDHPERAERAQNIAKALAEDPTRFSLREPEVQPIAQIERQHAAELLSLYERSAGLEAGNTFYPSVFFYAGETPPDPQNINHAGYYCFDAGTPLSREVLEAIRWSAACAVEAARTVLGDEASVAYALSRPPGHHATVERFGGYCYINNNALAAHELRALGRVAIVDVDVHHGNGQQSIFWRDPNVLTVSVHNDPRQSFPYFTGFESEVGAGEGKGFNVNVALPAGTDGQAWEQAFVGRVSPAIRDFAPSALVIAAGVDAYHKDPIGKFALTTEDFFRVGELLGALRLPTCVVQEGGYHTPDIGLNVRALLEGLREGQSLSGR